MLTRYLPRNPVDPNTVATIPETEERPPGPYFIKWSIPSLFSRDFDAVWVEGVEEVVLNVLFLTKERK